MIQNSFNDEFKHQIAYRDEYADALSKRLIIKPLYDKTYNDAAWVKQVQELVKDTTLDVINNYGFHVSGYNDARVGLIGASKDGTSYYLKLFPQYKSVNVEIENDVHATTIREDFLANRKVSMDCPVNVRSFLMDFHSTETYKQLRSELEFVRDYKKQWEVSPYPVKHATVRSTLGRVITKAYHFKLPDDTKLPKVKGADDAEKAKWVPISDLREEDFFDDHYFIISYFLGL